MNKLLYTILLSVVFASCENDIDFNGEDSRGTFCLNAFLNAGDTTHVISFSTTDYTTTHEVSGAVLRLYINDVLASESVTETPYYFSNSNVLHGVFRPGDHVRVEAEYQGRKATSEGIVPQPPKAQAIKGAIVQFSYGNDGFREAGQSIALTFSVTDTDASQTNYYRITCGTADSIASPLMLDPDPESRDYYIFFSTEWNELQRKYLPEASGTDALFESTTNFVKPDCDFTHAEVPSLTDEESNTKMEDFDFIMPTIKNKYHVMNDKRFSGSAQQMTLYKNYYRYSTDYFYHGYTYNLTNEQIAAIAPQYFLDGVVRIIAIDADQYYYLKLLNSIDSDYYSDDENVLSGTIKVPSNVSGGTGNVFLSASTEIYIRTLDGVQCTLSEPTYYNEPAYEE
ncbi:MAG: DUF4249 family protein [Bacteroidales bacterium]|nr:DUF4249 family protein [Bacteroidales bacterium]